MNIFFYLTHTLYAKPLIPLIIKAVDARHNVFIRESRFNFLNYNTRRYAGNPVSNTFVNKSSFDYVASISNYLNEWAQVREKVSFIFLKDTGKFDMIIGTTKNLDKLKQFSKRLPGKPVLAIGYQHMPFVISFKGGLKEKNLPSICLEVFTKANAFSKIHRFQEYISNYEISFRGFPYLDKAYSDYYKKQGSSEKIYALVFHPGGYREVITKKGDNKEACYRKQKFFLDTILSPILKKNLIPVIKVHPLAAKHHFKEDIENLLGSLSKEKRDFLKVLVEDKNYYKYLYKSDTIVTFGSSGIYELFSLKVKNILVCNFFGKERSRKFSFMKGPFIETRNEYEDFWNKERNAYFEDAYKRNSILEKVYQSYSMLFEKDLSGSILKDAGVL